MTDWADELATLDASNRRLLVTAASFTDDDLRAPSVLPGWTRGHVLAHLARNADSLGNLVTWARTGVETPAYVSDEARDADIEAGSGRSAAATVDDLASASERLADALAALDDDGRAATVRLRDGSRLAARALPMIRTRELEIHHVDLLGGYRPADWPDAFVRRTLDKLAPMFAKRGNAGAHALEDDEGGRWVVGPASGPTLHSARPDLLVWLIGRALPVSVRAEPEGAGVPPSPQW